MRHPLRCRLALASLLTGLLIGPPLRGQAQRPAADTVVPATDGAYVLQSWTVTDGLPVNGIGMLRQDRDRYLWAATNDGLVRFDGLRFSVYRAATSRGLSSSRIAATLPARDGTLWIRTDRDELARLRGETFTRFDTAQGIGGAVRAIHEARDGRIWIGMPGRIGTLRDDRFVAAARVDGGQSPLLITERADGSIWFVTDSAHLFRVEAGQMLATDLGAVGADRPTLLFEDAARTLWIGSRRALFRYGRAVERVYATTGVTEVMYATGNRSASMVTPTAAYRIESGALTATSSHVAGQPGSFIPGAVARDDAGTMWFALGNALFRNGSRVFTFAPAAGSFPTQATVITEILPDRDGGVWFGTASAGLHRLSPSRFRMLGEPEGLPMGNVYTIAEDRDGATWIGSWGRGVSRVQQGVVTNFGVDRGTTPFVTAMQIGRDGRLWLGGLEDGVHVCELRPVRCARPPDTEAWRGNVRAILEDRDGLFWFGSSDGLFTYDGTTRRRIDAAGNPRVRAFAQTRDGAIWMGTNGNGLLRHTNGRIERITTAEGLSGRAVRALYEDADGWLWVGLEGNGLARIDAKRWGTAGAAPIATFDMARGLYDDVIHQILEDRDGRLWMNSNRGIFWVERAALLAAADDTAKRVRSVAYTERDGLRSREGNGGVQPAGMRGRDGRLWFPTQAGAAVIDPSAVLSARFAVQPVIERVTSNGAVFDGRHGEVRLDVDQRDVQIEYTAPDYVAPGNLRFRYRLDPYDRDWVEAGALRSAFYTRLPPGRYTFRVSAMAEDRVWHDAPAGVAIRVRPRIVETWWFRLTGGAVLLLLAYGAVRLRLRSVTARAVALQRTVDERTTELRAREQELSAQNTQLGLQAEQLQALDVAKSRFFANVSHELRTPLTLTIAPLEDARALLPATLREQAGPSLDLALRNSRRVLALVDQIMDVAKLEAQHMPLRARPLDLVLFVRGVSAAFASLAERQRIALEIIGPKGGVDVWADQDGLEKVLSNLLANAFRFTPDGGRIVVHVGRDDADRRLSASGVARLRVSDSGPGIPEADWPHVFDRFFQVDEPGMTASGTGIGLALVKELADLHGGDVTVESGRYGLVGASFTLTLPLGRTHLADDQLAVDAVTDAVTLEAAEPPDLDRTTLLIAEDNRDLLAYLREHFSRRYRVITAVDGQEAVERARLEPPDLVISDVVMPRLDGRALCAALRANPDTDFIPVILLTALGDQEHRISALDGGADEYLVKPFAMRELDARVANLIASRQRLRERFGGSDVAVPPIDWRAPAGDVDSVDLALIARVRGVIEARLSDASFGVSELAAAVAVDRSHLSRRLSDVLQESPTDLIRRLRLERAAATLTSTDRTVSEVAYDSGFNGVSYFCRCFKDTYGMTPAAYRAAHPGPR